MFKYFFIANLSNREIRTCGHSRHSTGIYFRHLPKKLKKKFHIICEKFLENYLPEEHLTMFDMIQKIVTVDKKTGFDEKIIENYKNQY